MNKNNEEIRDLVKLFIESIYPKIGTEEVLDVFYKVYYLPNKELLDFHYTKWGDFAESDIVDMINDWTKERFEKTIEAYQKIDLDVLKNTVNKVNSELKAVCLEFNLLVGNLKSGLYIHINNGQGRIFCDLEVLSSFKNVNDLINRAVYHEAFHLFHNNALQEINYYSKNHLIDHMISDGMADYYTYSQALHTSVSELLLMDKESMTKLDSNKNEYWSRILDSIKKDNSDISIIKFTGTSKMRREYAVEEDMPERAAYYFGFYGIKALVESGDYTLNELTKLKPNRIFEEVVRRNIF